MTTIKDISKSCKAAVFYDYKIIGIIEEINQARRFIFNNFHETIHVSRTLITLSIIDVVILKINDINIENVIETIQDSEKKILSMLSSVKVIREEEADETD